MQQQEQAVTLFTSCVLTLTHILFALTSVHYCTFYLHSESRLFSSTSRLGHSTSPNLPLFIYCNHNTKAKHTTLQTIPTTQKTQFIIRNGFIRVYMQYYGTMILRRSIIPSGQEIALAISPAHTNYINYKRNIALSINYEIKCPFKS